MEIVSAICVRDHAGKRVVVLRFVLVRDFKQRFCPQTFLCTNRSLAPEQILASFVQRWQMETTFDPGAAPGGVETQRQWNDLAIARTTPVLLGLFSLVTLWADRLHAREELEVRQAAWYVKERATFSEALACVRRQLWPSGLSATSASEADMYHLAPRLLERFDTLCYAA